MKFLDNESGLFYQMKKNLLSIFLIFLLYFKQKKNKKLSNKIN